MTLSDLKWPFHASRAISAVAGLLVLYYYIIFVLYTLWHYCIVMKDYDQELLLLLLYCALI